jgi:hypothetical protein
MNVSNVSSGGVERRAERAVELVRPDARALGPDRRSDRREDSATISDVGRGTLDWVRDLTDRARRPESDRREKLDAARARLDAGDLDHPDVYRAVSDRMLRGLL